MRMLSAERMRYEQILTPLEHNESFQAAYKAARDVDLTQAVRDLRTA
jgi:hypothetical protein